MAQHDYVIANDTAANVRADINNALAAVASNNSGAAAPATIYANEWWYDTATGTLKIRAEANDAWISVALLNQTTDQAFPIVGGVTVTSTGTELNLVDGSVAGTIVNSKAVIYGAAGQVNATTLQIAGTNVTATAAELNYLDITTLGTSEASKAVTAAADGSIKVADAVTTDADNDGTFTTGTYTPTPLGGNMKRIVNGGAFTLAAPTLAGDYTLVIQITNNASAGAITLSGFDRTVGSAFTTTNGHDFFVFITKCNGFELANVVALQ
jgi:hypothetical protein